MKALGELKLWRCSQHCLPFLPAGLRDPCSLFWLSRLVTLTKATELSLSCYFCSWICVDQEIPRPTQQEPTTYHSGCWRRSGASRSAGGPEAQKWELGSLRVHGIAVPDSGLLSTAYSTEEKARYPCITFCAGSSVAWRCLAITTLAGLSQKGCNRRHCFIVLNSSTLYLLLLLFLSFIGLALHIDKEFEVWLLICALSVWQG